MPNATFFLGTECFGTHDLPIREVPGGKVLPHGRAFFCPLCVSTWAVALVESQPTQCVSAFCEKHSYSDRTVGTWSFGHLYYWDVPGSLWRVEDSSWNSSLPLPLLAREFILHLNHKEFLENVNR